MFQVEEAASAEAQWRDQAGCLSGRTGDGSGWRCGVRGLAARGGRGGRSLMGSWEELEFYSMFVRFRSFIRSFVRSFVHSFVHSCKQPAEGGVQS